MATQKKLLAERKPSKRPRKDESLSLRSAETLGRVIGTLQRQLDGVMRRLKSDPMGASGDAQATVPRTPRRKSVRPRLAASTDPSPARHPRKNVVARSRAAGIRTAAKRAKRTMRPK